MRNSIIILTLLGLSWISAQPLRAQTTPAAVVADPPVDTKFPPGLAGITVPSHGVDMDATVYLASGAGPHGTVLLLYGLPGYESNGDLAQSIRRAGWNVLLFHYRGTWGTAGTFSQSSAIEDTAEAVRLEPCRYGSPCRGATAQECGCARPCSRGDRPQLLRSSNCFADDSARVAREIEEIWANRQALTPSRSVLGMPRTMFSHQDRDA